MERDLRLQDFTEWESARPLNCPRCRESMDEIIEGYPIYYCSKEEKAFLLETFIIPDDNQRYLWLYEDKDKAALVFTELQAGELIELIRFIKDGERQD